MLDLSQGTALETVSNAVSTMIQRGVPVRFGLVPMYDPEVDDTGESPGRWDIQLMCSEQDGETCGVQCEEAWARQYEDDAC